MSRWIKIILLILVIYGIELNAQNVATYTVNTSVKYQEIDHFGASDCWTMYRFGKFATEDNIEKVADLLFSKEFDEHGNPKGIGLSMWRMNFGAGSHDNAFQKFREIRARMPCILKKNGYYDMSIDGSCGGQFRFLQEAKERDCEYLLGFCNSPPYFMTRSGYTTGGEDSNKPMEAQYSLSLNLDEAGIESFTEYLSEVLKRTEEVYNLSFDYVDPVNEPEWGAWMGENMHATNADIRDICVSLNQKLEAKGLSTRIAIPESARLDYIYSIPSASAPLVAADYGMKAKNFFSEEGDSYVGNLSHISRHIAGHGYFTTNLTMLNYYRRQVAEAVKENNVKYWMTEYSLGDSFDDYVPTAQGVDTTINYGLFVARIIHSDLTSGNASAWHWWLALSDVDYKDGLLYLRRNNDYNVVYQLTDDRYGIVPDSRYAEVYGDCQVVPTKMLWCMGNYSRFIRPFAHRVAVESSVNTDNLTGIMISAYQNSDGKIVVVVLNYSEENKPVIIRVDGKENVLFRPYITSDHEMDNMRSLDLVNAGANMLVPKRSITTYVEEEVSSVNDITTGSPVYKIEKGGISLEQTVKHIGIYDETGRALKTYNKKREGDFISLLPGFYVIRVQNEQGNKVEKVIIK